MPNKYGSPYCNNILELISIFASLISYILFVYQSFLNYNFRNSNSREIIAEKYLYQNFYEEINNNIKMRLIKNITIEEKKEDISKSYLNLEVKLDSFFDCRGETNGLLNEKECQDKIVSNLTCCRSECCNRINDNIKCNNYNFDLKKSYNDKTIINYNEEERIEDPRRRFCKYFNKYNNSTSKLLNITFKVEEDYNYQEFLMRNEYENVKVSAENIEGFNDCGELDTLKNHLFVKNKPCPINYIIRGGNKIYFDSFNSMHSYPKKMIVRNILSEIPPNIHEWNNYNYENINDNIITIKDVNKIIKENENYYEKQDAYFYIDEISDFYDKYKDKVNKFQKLYWYTSNYIGFKNVNEFLKFQTIFNDTKNNSLYEITKTKIIPSLISAIFGLLLIIFCLAYTTFFLISLKIDFMFKKPLFIIKEIIILVSVVAGLFLLFFSPKYKFETIEIIMDEHYKEILDLYNRRRSQNYLLAAFIIIIFVLLYEIYFIFFARKSRKTNKIIDKGSESSENINNAKVENINNAKVENKNHGPEEQIYSIKNENFINTGRTELLRRSKKDVQRNIGSYGKFEYSITNQNKNNQ